MTYQQSILVYIGLLIDQTDISLEQFSNGTIFLKLLSLISNCHVPSHLINTSTYKFSDKLANMKFVLRKLEEQFKQKIGTDFKTEVDIMKIVKTNDEEQIVKLFEIILQIYLSDENRDFFIEKILQLGPKQQEYLAKTIQNILEKKSNNIHDQEQDKLKKISELQEENYQLKQNLDIYKGQNQNLKSKVEELLNRIEILQNEVNDAHNFEQNINYQRISNVQNYQYEKKICQLNETITNLKHQHQEQLEKYRKQLAISEKKNSQIFQLQQCLQQYEERLAEQKNKNSLIEKQKSQLDSILTEKTNKLNKIESQLKISNSKVFQLQFDKINMRIESERNNVRNSELQNQFKKKLSTSGYESARSHRNRLSQICPEVEQDNLKHRYQELQQELTIKNKRIRELEKQLSKNNSKVDRIQKYELQNKKFNEYILDLKNTYQQQINILASALYELRTNYRNNRGYLTVHKFNS